MLPPSLLMLPMPHLLVVDATSDDFDMTSNHHLKGLRRLGRSGCQLTTSRKANARSNCCAARELAELVTGPLHVACVPELD